MANQNDINTETNNDIQRRNKVPVIFVTGTHYEVGYDVGRTFSSMIKNFIANYQRLHDFETKYKTEAGKRAYDLTLLNVKKQFPYYVNEIQGTADGAGVPFHQLFLLQMDDIIETINDTNTDKDTGGCSSIGVNSPDATILGHTEDTFAETLNHFYILSAHIIPSLEDKAQGATNERFASLCYAGHLPGYTMGFTENGLVFTINTLSPKYLKPGNTPRTFLTRAMLAAQNKQHLVKILTNEGVGTANGFSLNMIWANMDGKKRLYNVEVAPDLEATHSIINEQEFGGEDALIHCNRYHRVKVLEVVGLIIDSSAARLEALHTYPVPKHKCDIETMLSDQSGKEFVVFQNKDDAIIKTIAAGIFDLEEMTWNIYTDKPNVNEPVAMLPIRFYKFN